MQVHWRTSIYQRNGLCNRKFCILSRGLESGNSNNKIRLNYINVPVLFSTYRFKMGFVCRQAHR